jgi:hypothetical protein
MIENYGEIAPKHLFSDDHIGWEDILWHLILKIAVTWFTESLFKKREKIA